MGVVRKSISASGIWLLRRVMKLAQSMDRAGVSGGSKKQILEGYLLIAKKSGKSMSAVVIDLPAWLCLPGRYIRNGGFNYSRYYVQTLPLGRDSYMPSTLNGVLPSQEENVITAGTYLSTKLGSSANQLAATHYWGVAQPFNGVGGMHAFSAIASNQYRWPMAYASDGQEFFWRLVVIAPTTARFTDGTTTPSQPAQPVSSWTLDIGESILSAQGAVAITRLLDQTVEGYELNWEGSQYPWISIGRPQSFFSDSGEYGYRICVLAQVVYEQGGPYYWYGTPDRPDDPVIEGAWPENTSEWNLVGDGEGIPSGGRGLWAADIEVVGQTASVANAYRVFAGSTDREPVLRGRKPQGLDGDWYLTNITYRSPIVTLNNEDGTHTSVAVSASLINRTPDGYVFDPPTPQPFDGSLFLDATWFDGGSTRRQNLSQTKLARGKYYSGKSSNTEYAGGSVAYDIGDKNEGRFTIGADTDGSVGVFPVFSSFGPGEWPLLRVYALSRDGVRVGYSGVPGFSWCVARGAGEQMVINYGVVDNGQSDASLAEWGEWITYPAPSDHVTYIGNGRFIFYASNQLSQRPEDNDLWAPAGNIAVATYSVKTNAVSLQGVIDDQLYSTGFGADGAYQGQQAFQYVQRAHLIPVFADPAKLGRIEVVRPESDGYDPNIADTAGHPATLIASEGCGRPGLTLAEFDSQDVKRGRTWISYDSGATWVQILNYGSPAGSIHCGNIAQARTEPVVRV